MKEVVNEYHNNPEGGMGDMPKDEERERIDEEIDEGIKKIFEYHQKIPVKRSTLGIEEEKLLQKEIRDIVNFLVDNKTEISSLYNELIDTQIEKIMEEFDDAILSYIGADDELIVKNWHESGVRKIILDVVHRELEKRRKQHT